MIYLDYAATTPVDRRVLAVMEKELADVYGNASSLYAPGRTARSHVEAARRQVAALLGRAQGSGAAVSWSVSGRISADSVRQMRVFVHRRNMCCR